MTYRPKNIDGGTVGINGTGTGGSTRGASIPLIASPAAPAEGEVWISSTSNRVSYRSGGTTNASEAAFNKNAASGYAGLDSSSRVAVAQLALALLAPTVGAVGYANRGTPTFATDYTPSTTRPTLVLAKFSIACAPNTVTSQDGKVQALLNAGATEVAADEFLWGANAANAGGTITMTRTLAFLVPANVTYRVTSTQVTGTPTITLLQLAELTL